MRVVMTVFAARPVGFSGNYDNKGQVGRFFLYRKKSQ